MLVQYDYVEPEPSSVLDRPPKSPTLGAMLKVQGEPDSDVLIGIIMAVVQHDRPLNGNRVSTLSILLPDDQDGVRALSSWLRDGGDLGIMVV